MQSEKAQNRQLSRPKFSAGSAADDYIGLLDVPVLTKCP